MTAPDLAAIRARLDAYKAADTSLEFMDCAADLRWHAPADLAALLDEVERLTRWKAEATEVISAWERLHDDLGKPGALGESKAAATRREVARLTAECDEHAAESERRRRALLDTLIRESETQMERSDALAERDAARAALAAFRADVETLRAIGADSYHGCVAAKALAAVLAKHTEEDA